MSSFFYKEETYLTWKKVEAKENIKEGSHSAHIQAEWKLSLTGWMITSSYKLIVSVFSHQVAFLTGWNQYDPLVE